MAIVSDMSGTIDFVLIACIVAALIASVRMCAKDAIRRGKSPWLVSLMVILFFPVGLLAWLRFRPKILPNDDSKRKFELDDFRVQ